MRLCDYFTERHVDDALAGYIDFQSAKKDWGIGHRLDLYNLAKAAFASDLPEEEQRKAFRSLYDVLKGYWKLFRNADGPCWTADKAFDGLSCYFQPFARESGQTLETLCRDDLPSLLTSLRYLDGLKPMGQYPHMAVSKILHFFNPSLFPIYDGEVIWNKVCRGTFKQDYDAFCARNSYRIWESRANFNVYYTHWASEIMQDADGSVMRTFAEWFRAHADGHVDPLGVLDDVRGYYGAAFELVAIGAMQIESS